MGASEEGRALRGTGRARRCRDPRHGACRRSTTASDKIKYKPSVYLRAMQQAHDARAALDAWVRDYKVEELVESAQLRRIPYAPVRDLESLATHEQLVERGFLERTQNTDNRTQTGCWVIGVGCWALNS